MPLTEEARKAMLGNSSHNSNVVSSINQTRIANILTAGPNGSRFKLSISTRSLRERWPSWR